ncbi:MAG: FUSC family protein [Deltaproteobacteria bacterium]|jgi:uncharacterized membrane protein YccC|nr:FUSC family protein [Deltaproteobacteria bacterium]
MAHTFLDDIRNMHSLLRMHIRHAFKTGLAAAMAYAISSLLGSNFGIWAVISALIVMQGISVADSLQESLSRFTLMSLGALPGMLLLVVSPKNTLLLTLETFSICFLGAYLGRYGKQFTLATTAACIVLLTGMQYIPQATLLKYIMFGLTLSLEVLLGVACAISASALLWPVRLGDTLRSDIAAQCDKCAALLDTVVNAYLDHQNHVPYNQFDGLCLQIRSNRERLLKARKLEAHIYHYEYKSLELRVEAIERCMESMRALIDALNEYDEEACDPPLGPELRALADVVMRAFRRLGGKDSPEPESEIARDLTMAIDKAEARLTFLRGGHTLNRMPLHRILQLYTFYQVLRHLSEALLLSMRNLQALNGQSGAGAN